ncbi:hypothetical protein Tco_0949096 [Tanacetum coccineum]
MECKIVGKILIDRALSYALTATADVPAVYLQQFWKTVKKVPNANETIHFMLDRKGITYTIDMFRLTLQLLVETLENPFCTSNFGIHTTIYEDHMCSIVVLPQEHLDMIRQRLTFFRSFISWSIVFMLTMLLFYGGTLFATYSRTKMLSNEFLTNDIRATKEYKENEKAFIGIDVPTIQPQPVESTQGKIRTPTPTTIVGDVV